MEYLYLYPDLSTKIFHPEEIVEYLKTKLPATKISLREDFFVHWLGLDKEKYNFTAKNLASCRIADLNSKSEKVSKTEPLPIEIEYEKNNLANPKERKIGILYDGFCFQNIYREIMTPHELRARQCHIIFTNQLIATYEESDARYHLRTSVYGVPNLISTSGIVEAPAKPKEYYLMKGLSEIVLAEWKEKNKERFIDYDDPRLTEVAKGYVMQAIFYYLIGEPFCKNKSCRLYNAHWQEEMIKAQLNKSKEFCVRHQMILDSL